MGRHMLVLSNSLTLRLWLLPCSNTWGRHALEGGAQEAVLCAVGNSADGFPPPPSPAVQPLPVPCMPHRTH